MKLFVDDIRKPPDDTWTVARTVTEAIRLLSRFSHWDEISLDHDISHFENLDEKDVDQDVRACTECFCAVAYYIAQKWFVEARFEDSEFALMSPRITPQIWLHTANPVGGDEMYAILKERGIRVEKNYTGVKEEPAPK